MAKSKIVLTEEQRKSLTKLWFIFGNNGNKHSHENHRYIQNILEHGEDTQAFYNAKHTKANITDECISRVKEIIISCPECSGKIRSTLTHTTEWYGRLEFFTCKECKKKLVIQNEEEINLSSY